MEALSYCSNFGYHDHQQDYYNIYQQAEPEFTIDQLFNFQENLDNSFSDSFINPLFDSDEAQNYSETYNNIIPYLTSPSDDLISLTPDIIPIEEFHTPKRQKLTNSDEFQVNLAEYIVNSDPVSGFLPEISAPLPKFEAPVLGFNAGRSDQNNNNGKKSLSPQSIAARERRRRITDKTHELGKLIPGGNKMNTAEMLQAASHYVKFLQAQVQLLQSMDSTSEEKQVEFEKNGLQVLLTSSTMQEKLYSQEKCLVPKEFLETLKNDSEIQLKPFVINEIDQVIGKK